MPWYKFYAMHGPGHQGTTEAYRFYEKPLSRGDREEVWENWVYREGFENAVGRPGVRLIRRLPEKVRQEKIEGFRNEIKHATSMLRSLGVRK